ncbi:MAG TPA: YcaO-like family protein [Candidatus Paceibacterota bacterium]|nr:YcaO-like family protein [Candidatus Paceibacterota bacterium]
MANKQLIKSLSEITELTTSDRKQYSKIFSDKIGIVNALLRRNDLSRYGYSMFQSLSAKTTVLFNRSREVSSGGLGINKDSRFALHSCMGESLERYCMSYYNKEELFFGSHKELPKEMRFDDFSLYSKEQYGKNKTFADPLKEKIYWDKIESFLTPGKFKYWPASLIYLPFDEGKISAETTSTGMAAGTDKKRIITSGLMELIERDALMTNFLQRLNPPEILINSINDPNKFLIKKLLRDGYKIKIYKLYSDINLPIFVGLVWKGKEKNIHYGIGACASLDSERAINKTLEECLFTFLYSKNIMDAKPKNKESIKALYEHFLYYQDEKFNQLVFNSETVKYLKEKYSFNQLLENLKKLGIEVFFKELTTKDIESTKVRVFRVVAPGLVDLNKSHLLPREGAKRLWSTPLKLGLKTERNLSPLPHPFP